jgi:hypothetical protein
MIYILYIIGGFFAVAAFSFAPALIIYATYNKIKRKEYNIRFTSDPKFWIFYRFCLLGIFLVGYLWGIVQNLQLMF